MKRIILAVVLVLVLLAAGLLVASPSFASELKSKISIAPETKDMKRVVAPVKAKIAKETKDMKKVVHLKKNKKK